MAKADEAEKMQKSSRKLFIFILMIASLDKINKEEGLKNGCSRWINKTAELVATRTVFGTRRCLGKG